MRYIKVPAPASIPMSNAAGEPEVRAYSFANFVGEFVLSDKKFRDSWAKHYSSILESFPADLSAGKVVALESDDWEKIRECVNAANLPPHLNAMLMPFCHAVTLAPTKSPED